MKFLLWMKSHKVISGVAALVIITASIITILVAQQNQEDINTQNYIKAEGTIVSQMQTFTVNKSWEAGEKILNACHAYAISDVTADPNGNNRTWPLTDITGLAILTYPRFISNPGDAIVYAGESLTLVDNTGTVLLQGKNTSGLLYNNTGKVLHFDTSEQKIYKGEIYGFPAIAGNVAMGLNHALCIANQQKVKLTTMTLPADTLSWLADKIKFYRELLPRK